MAKKKQRKEHKTYKNSHVQNTGGAHSLSSLCVPVRNLLLLFVVFGDFERFYMISMKFR